MILFIILGCSVIFFKQVILLKIFRDGFISSGSKVFVGYGTKFTILLPSPYVITFKPLNVEYCVFVPELLSKRFESIETRLIQV